MPALMTYSVYQKAQSTAAAEHKQRCAASLERYNNERIDIDIRYRVDKCARDILVILHKQLSQWGSGTALMKTDPTYAARVCEVDPRFRCDQHGQLFVA